MNQSDAAVAIIFTALLRWVGLSIVLLIVLPYADGWVMGLIAKL